LNDNLEVMRPRSRSLRDEYGQKSRAWETGKAEMVRFWDDTGDCYGFVFSHLTAAVYNEKHKRLLIDWPVGTLVIAGPKVLEFFDDFAAGRVTMLKPDGEDITSVAMQLRRERGVEQDANGSKKEEQ
jgi:hypothetical protein